MIVAKSKQVQGTLSLFDSQTGRIHDRFKRQLDLVGIVVEQHFKEYSNDHVLNVDYCLQNNGCFQRDWEIYKKGGDSAFKISDTQAQRFLDDEYQEVQTYMPHQKNCKEAIFMGGVEPTLHKRFHSLIESMKEGYQYEVLHFIAKDDQGKSDIQRLVEGQYKEALKGIHINIVVAHTDLGILEKGLKLLEDSQALGQEYAIISDSAFASKAEKDYTMLLPNRTCLGIASVPIKDWKFDMNLYGYVQALGNEQKATIAWARSRWNVIARQVNTEAQSFKKAQGI